MLDIKFVRENPDIVKENIKKKFQDSKLELVDEVITLDAENRKTQQEADELRANRNKISKEIGGLMAQGKKEEAEAKKAVEAGYWQLYRYNPELTAQGKNPFTLDSKPATIPYREFIMGEVRYASLLAQFPEVADKLFDRAEHEAKDKYEYYKKLNDMQ